MTDYFAIFGAAPRPALSENWLKEKFLALSQQKHPDHQQAKGSTDDFASLNAAYQCLKEPKDRLGHLIEVVTGAKPAKVQNVPEGILQLFLAVARVCQGADGFLREQAALQSPILKAAAYPKSLEWTGEIQALQARVAAEKQLLQERLEKLDGRWDRGSEEAMRELNELHLAFSYISRWQGQLQEKLTQLAL